jgi:predicted DCC family thiol-disulfide oxidoreductase YuxK
VKRPLLIYDGDCGFCRVWIERWRAATGDAVEYAPYQSAASRHPEVPRERFAEAVHLFEPGATSRGAEAALRALSYGHGGAWWTRLYSAFSPILESGYSFVASRRVFASRATRLLWGESAVPPPVGSTARLALAAIGLCYLAGFVSFAVQAEGLIGENGIMPAARLLPAAKAQLGLARFWAFPTLAWLGASDAALLGLAWGGAAASLGLIAGIAAGPCALACWALYLSLSAVGADFMSFQWDALLLEAGLIACFLPAWRGKGGGASRAALWLLRLLLVKLMLQSGLVKLLSGDQSWRELTALTWHYWTQPLPTPLAWWADRAPLWFQKFSCGVMFAIELGSPLLLLMPRRARFLGAAAVAFLMIVIAATGNYGFFNLLTLALCAACLDDRLLGREAAAPAASRLRSRAALALGALWLSVSLVQTLAVLGVRPPLPARWVLASLAPLRSINNYGLFAVMTKARDEIVLEVSADGRDWREWPFPYKPGDPRRAPPWVAPHMPRLDWQMWFASLGEAGDSPWYGNFLFRLLEGKPEVAALLGPNPLGATPVYVRAIRYSTVFASPEERRADGSWWKRTRGGLYSAVVTLRP